MNSNTKDLKNHIHKLISETEDEGMLNKVHAYISALPRQRRGLVGVDFSRGKRSHS